MRAISGKEGKVKEYVDAMLHQGGAFAEHVSQVLIPTEKVVTVTNGKRKVKEKYRYIGYVFSEAELVGEVQATLRNIPDVLGFLSDTKSSTTPMPLRPAEVKQMLGTIDEIAEIPEDVDIPFEVGESVKVTEGPFSGFDAVIEEVIKQAVPKRMITADTKIYVNPTGRFVIGGPQGDSGLTGRKIIVDTYGGYARHGGGAFSGKDPTKVDRTGAYYSRYIAKNLVAAGLADKCELQLAYAIGVAQPVSVLVDTFGTGKLDDLQLAEIVRKHFDMRPAAMIEELELRKPVYQQVAAYGHMGRPDLDLSWERTTKAEILKQYLK